jgi:TRAP transporter 4TM/12TM fusion protein
MSDETRSATAEAVAYDPEQAARDIAKMSEAAPVTEVVGPVRTELHPAWKWIVWSLGLGMSLFHLYTAWHGTLPTVAQGTVHLAFGLALIFLIYNSKRNPEKEKVRGLIWTGGGLLVLLYLMSTTGLDLEIVVPSALILVLVQVTRYLRLELGGMPLADVVLAGLAVWACAWIYLNYSDFNQFIIRGLPATGLAAATIGTLLVLVAASRAVGIALSIVGVGMFAYALFASNLPGFLWHTGKNPDSILTDTFIGTRGIFGTPLQVSSTFIFLFMIFAALLQRTGMERFFTNLALGLAGSRVGGTAKVGVITSVFSGTITGSSVANTVSNGAFTIPMMKRSGYSREFSGAVEAASSTGGQICPPVMGAAAFIMLQTIGGDIRYIDILKAAVIPAILFFTAQYVVVHFVSKREGILGLPRDQLPNLGRLLLTRGYLMAPLILIFVILSTGMTPMAAAFYAVLATVALNIVVQLGYLLIGGVQAWKDMPDKLTPKSLADALVDAAKMALPIVAACAAAGIISGTINSTLLGTKIGNGLIDLGDTLSQYLPFGNSQLYLVLFFTMIACLILGIGLPTTANYVVMAAIAVPAVLPLISPRYEDMGLEAFQIALIAHMFVYYFGVLADITPPVCLAAFAAAGISGGNPVKTGVQAVRIAISGFIVPYAFVLAPEILMLGDDWGKLALVVLTAIVGVSFLGMAMAGHLMTRLNWIERVLLLLAALFMLGGSNLTDGIGLALGAAVIAVQYMRRDRGGDAEVTGEPVAPRPAPAGGRGGAGAAAVD